MKFQITSSLFDKLRFTVVSAVYVVNRMKVRSRLQRTSGKWGGGVVLKFRTFPDGGRGVVCESSDVRKFLKKNISQSSITVSVVLF